jgi:hypothetical protein
MTDQLAPFLEVGRVAEVDGVVLDRVPGDEQPVACSDIPLQPLARWKIGAALATPVSNSCSRPGFTSIWAISRIICGLPCKRTERARNGGR